MVVIKSSLGYWRIFTSEFFMKQYVFVLFLIFSKLIFSSNDYDLTKVSEQKKILIIATQREIIRVLDYLVTNNTLLSDTERIVKQAELLRLYKQYNSLYLDPKRNLAWAFYPNKYKKY